MYTILRGSASKLECVRSQTMIFHCRSRFACVCLCVYVYMCVCMYVLCVFASVNVCMRSSEYLFWLQIHFLAKHAIYLFSCLYTLQPSVVSSRKWESVEFAKT